MRSPPAVVCSLQTTLGKGEDLATKLALILDLWAIFE